MFSRTLLTGVAAVAVTLAATTAAAQEPVTSVHEAGGEYVVSATFTVPGSPGTAREVLTDYANIPRFMPNVRSSAVVNRQDGRVRVEQDAEPQFMWFSRKIHLVLDVDEGANVIRFRDTSGTSFAHYDGSWAIAAQHGETRLTYSLVARPAFSVPGFVLKKLLKRDAVTMVGRLQAEIGARGLAD
jgi:uncharacterized membrane protein